MPEPDRQESGTHREWVEETLDLLPFVEWDRFTTGEWGGDSPYVTVYGWLPREQDEYKDFVLLILWPETETVYFSTSSAEWTEEIYEALYDDSLENHNDCQRVEDTFDVDNAVKLVTDGGQDVTCDYCDSTDLAYELRSDRGDVARCIPCLAVEQGQQQLGLPFEAFVDFDHAESSYEDARDWYRILARIRQDDPILKRDPDDFGTVGDGIRTFLTNIMGSAAHYSPSEIVEADGDPGQVTPGGDV